MGRVVNVWTYYVQTARMCDESTDSGVDGSIGRRVPVRNRWSAIDLVGCLGLVRYPPPRPTGRGAHQDDQRHDSNRTKNAEEDNGYEPRPEALADLENRHGLSHGLSSENLSSGEKERQP